MSSHLRIVAAFASGALAAAGLGVAAIALDLLGEGLSMVPQAGLLGVAALGLVAGVLGLLWTIRSFKRLERELARGSAEATKRGVALESLLKDVGELEREAAELLRLTAGAEEGERAGAEIRALLQRLAAGATAREAAMEHLGSRLLESAAAAAKLDRVNVRALDAVSDLGAGLDEAQLAHRDSGAAARTLMRKIEEIAAGARAARGAVESVQDGSERARADARHVANTMASLDLESQRMADAAGIVMRGSELVSISGDGALDATRRFGDRLEGVEEVVGAIRTLAERTKMLSINASIIATDAGEHGRAFAVVANEIKDLAESTARAVAEIAALFDSLRVGCVETVQAAQRSREDLDRGVAMARGAVESLRAFPEQVRLAASLSGDLVSRIEEQMRRGGELLPVFERIAAGIEAAGDGVRQKMSHDEKLHEAYRAVERSSDTMRAVAKEQGASAADFARVSENVKLAFDRALPRCPEKTQEDDRLAVLFDAWERKSAASLQKSRALCASVERFAGGARDMSTDEREPEKPAREPKTAPETPA